MAFPNDMQERIYEYCNKHLPNDYLYDDDFELITDSDLKQRVIDEYKGGSFCIQAI